MLSDQIKAKDENTLVGVGLRTAPKEIALDVKTFPDGHQSATIGVRRAAI